jgi:hypothetical protein
MIDPQTIFFGVYEESKNSENLDDDDDTDFFSRFNKHIKNDIPKERKEEEKK